MGRGFGHCPYMTDGHKPMVPGEGDVAIVKGLVPGSKRSSYHLFRVSGAFSLSSTKDCGTFQGPTGLTPFKIMFRILPPALLLTYRQKSLLSLNIVNCYMIDPCHGRRESIHTRCPLNPTYELWYPHVCLQQQTLNK